MALLKVTADGLYCPLGGFHIDPSRGVDRALITHAHSDHARPGSSAYLCAREGVGLLRLRLGKKPVIQGVSRGETLRCGDVRVSFHPAGHMLGSAQIRIEHRGEIWVVSGDYKRDPDPTCADFEVVPCHTFITESTFGLPLYRWPESAGVFLEMQNWWRRNQSDGRTSVLYAYSIGKAQRLLAGLQPGPGPFLAHQAILDALPAYRTEGVRLPDVELATETRCHEARGQAILLTPPGPAVPQWLAGDDRFAFGMASGWMLPHHVRRKKAGERGFVLSDHVDWPALLRTVRETGAERLLVTHGFVGPVVRWFREQGMEAEPLEPGQRPYGAPSPEDLPNVLP